MDHFICIDIINECVFDSFEVHKFILNSDVIRKCVGKLHEVIECREVVKQNLGKQHGRKMRNNADPDRKGIG